MVADRIGHQPTLYPLQKMSFNPNWICRPTAFELLSLPKLGESTESAALLADARKNVGVLVKLKNSALNWSVVRSEKLVFLKTEKSVLTDPGPRATWRAELPNSRIGTPVELSTVPGTRNAAGLKY